MKHVDDFPFHCKQYQYKSPQSPISREKAGGRGGREKRRDGRGRVKIREKLPSLLRGGSN